MHFRPSSGRMYAQFPMLFSSGIIPPARPETKGLDGLTLSDVVMSHNMVMNDAIDGRVCHYNIYLKKNYLTPSPLTYNGDDKKLAQP